MSEVDLACFSYLAAVTTLHVTDYPRADTGSVVHGMDRFIAGDGPIVAGAAASLGLRTLLLSNSIAADDDGARLEGLLREWRVARAEPVGRVRSRTPCSTVICDSAGTRTYFPHLPDVAEELQEIDLGRLDDVRAVYADCYPIIAPAARRAVLEAMRRDVPVLANLGGSPLPLWLMQVGSTRRLMAIQTNTPDGDVSTMRRQAMEVAAADIAKVVLVTGGRAGALAVIRGEMVPVPAREVAVRQVQGAGSVFSAAFMAAAFFEGADVGDAVSIATAMATGWCERTSDQGFPRWEDERGASCYGPS